MPACDVVRGLRATAYAGRLEIVMANAV
ncbi:MAG: hypothetical protein V7638_29, partial [Acidobacteriota bacterium]